MDWKEFVMPNKIRVVYKELPQSHSVSTGLFIKAGGRFEPKNISGISHFIEHLLFKGTKKRSCNKIKEEIEGVGGTFNGFTSGEMTCYWIKILNDFFDLSVDVLTDMVQNPLMKPQDIEKERNVIIEEINMYRDIPSKYVFEVFQKQLFNNHPLGQSVAGTTTSVKKILRKDILSYLQDFYTAENILVSITGNISEKEIFKTTEKYLSSIKNKAENIYTEWTKKPTGTKIKSIYKKTEQTHILMGGIGLSRFDKYYHTSKVLNIILGGNMSSRLFNRIREDMSLAYAIRSITGSYNDTGVYAIYAGVAPKNTEKCISAVIDELRKIKDKGVTDNELIRAKKFLTSQFLMGLEDNLEYMLWLGEQKLMKNSITPKNDVLEKINGVKKKDIKELAEQIFQEPNFYLSLIGPRINEDTILKSIKKL